MPASLRKSNTFRKTFPARMIGKATATLRRNLPARARQRYESKVARSKPAQSILIPLHGASTSTVRPFQVSAVPVRTTSRPTPASASRLAHVVEARRG